MKWPKLNLHHNVAYRFTCTKCNHNYVADAPETKCPSCGKINEATAKFKPTKWI